MSYQKKKKRAYSKKTRQYEIRDYFAKKMLDSGVTLEKFNKLVGVKKK